jgi:hypothetical protein
MSFWLNLRSSQRKVPTINYAERLIGRLPAQLGLTRVELDPEHLPGRAIGRWVRDPQDPPEGGAFRRRSPG